MEKLKYRYPEVERRGLIKDQISDKCYHLNEVIDKSNELVDFVSFRSVIQKGYELADRTIYVAETGSDSSGKGYQNRPFRTIEKALESIKSVISNCDIVIQLSAGNYVLDHLYLEQLMGEITFLGGARLDIVGTPVLVEDGFTIAASASPYIYNVSGKTFTANEFRDKFLKVGTKYFHIMSNGTTTLNTHVGQGAGTEIYEMQSVITFASSDSSINFNGIAALPNMASAIRFKELTFDSGAKDITVTTASIELQFRDLLWNVNKFTVDGQTHKLRFVRAGFVCITGGIDNFGADVSIDGVSVRKSGTQAEVGIDFKQFSDTIIQSLYVSNFVTAIALTFGSWVCNQSGKNIILENATYAIQVRNKTEFTTTLTNVFIENVDYTFSSSETIGIGVKVYIESFTGTANILQFHSSVTIAATDATKDIYWIIT